MKAAAAKTLNPISTPLTVRRNRRRACVDSANVGESRMACPAKMGGKAGRVGRSENKKGVRGFHPSPLFPHPFEVRILEHELQTELHDARIALVRVRTGDTSERRAVYGSRRVREIHLVEYVEELRAELQAHVVAEAYIFAQAHIPVVGAGPEVCALADGTKRADISGCECRGIEPYRPIGTGWRVEADASGLCPIAADAIARDVGACADRIRRSALVLQDAGELPTVEDRKSVV